MPECDYCFSPMGDGEKRILGHDVLCITCFEAIIYSSIGEALLDFGTFIERDDRRAA